MRNKKKQSKNLMLIITEHILLGISWEPTYAYNFDTEKINIKSNHRNITMIQVGKLSIFLDIH